MFLYNGEAVTWDGWAVMPPPGCSAETLLKVQKLFEEIRKVLAAAGGVGFVASGSGVRRTWNALDNMYDRWVEKKAVTP